MTTSTIHVQGMTCAHCVNAVRSELSRLPGVSAVEIELHAGKITPVEITSDNELDRVAVAEAIVEAGYSPRASTASSANSTGSRACRPPSIC